MKCHFPILSDQTELTATKFIKSNAKSQRQPGKHKFSFYQPSIILLSTRRGVAAHTLISSIRNQPFPCATHNNLTLAGAEPAARGAIKANFIAETRQPLKAWLVLSRAESPRSLLQETFKRGGKRQKSGRDRENEDGTLRCVASRSNENITG